MLLTAAKSPIRPMPRVARMTAYASMAVLLFLTYTSQRTAPVLRSNPAAVVKCRDVYRKINLFMQSEILFDPVYKRIRPTLASSMCLRDVDIAALSKPKRCNQASACNILFNQMLWRDAYA